MISEEEANEKVREGWFKSWVMFEALAINENVAKDALESLVNKLDRDNRVKIYKKSFGETKRVETPIQNVEVGYSVTCEVNLISKKFDNLAQIAIEYGPSAIEILEPEKFNLDVGEAQSILNSISNMMHRLAAAGAGGIVFMRGEE
ncbi:MAG: hypothetical protein GTN40_00675 [Candidatus Aenigmarchaeota archaeon]|nr:hypothetical protein [Candidatus Aenigmarchaeota archaeon]